METLHALMLGALAHQARGNFSKGLGTFIIENSQYSQRGGLTLSMGLLRE
jgi:hypothetical protein